MPKPIWSEYAGPHGFWGYGSTWEEAEIIFIGPEFGGSGLDKRIRFWEATDRKQFVDLPPFMHALDKENRFVLDGTLSGIYGIKTFGSLMVMLMGAKPLDLRKCYAQNCFGRSDLATQISWSDLSALPCKNVSNKEFRKDYEVERKIYEETYLPPRVERVKQFFANSERKTVVLYGASSRLKPIFEGNWEEEKVDGHFHPIEVLRAGRHSAFRVAHPCAHHVKNAYFEECGGRIGILDCDKFESEVKARA